MHAGCTKHNAFCLGKPQGTEPGGSGKPISPGGYSLHLHTGSDGNLCTVDTSAKKVLWCARGVPAPVGPYHLLLGDDGSACIHAGTWGTPTATNATLWCSPAAPTHAPTRALSRIPGGVVLHGVTHSVVTGCSFLHMGGAVRNHLWTLTNHLIKRNAHHQVMTSCLCPLHCIRMTIMA